MFVMRSAHSTAILFLSLFVLTTLATQYKDNEEVWIAFCVVLRAALFVKNVKCDFK